MANLFIMISFLLFQFAGVSSSCFYIQFSIFQHMSN
jgi:hypothetical protein